jgi:hypothetical protein
MGKTLILKPLLRSLNTISFMLIIFTFQLIQTIRILWFCHKSESALRELPTYISYRKGIFCANFLASRGNWVPCQKAWCGNCYTPLEGGRFPMRLQKDDEGNMLVTEEDKLSFGFSRLWVIFCVPFKVHFIISGTFSLDPRWRGQSL